MGREEIRKQFSGDVFWIAPSGALGGFVDYRKSPDRLRVVGLNETGTAIIQDVDTISEINEDEGVIYTAFGKTYQIQNFHPMYKRFLEVARKNPDAVVAVNRSSGRYGVIEKNGYISGGNIKLDLPKGYKERDLRSRIIVFESHKLSKTVIVAPFSTEATKSVIGRVDSSLLEVIKNSSK